MLTILQATSPTSPTIGEWSGILYNRGVFSGFMINNNNGEHTLTITIIFCSR